MLQKWRLASFKSAYDRIELDLRPLTIFAGANSSGKSTFIQSMLLVAQTITNQVFNRPVILNGHIVRLGKYEDVASSDSDDRDISIGFTIKPSARAFGQTRGLPGYRYFPGPDFEHISCDFSFSSPRDHNTAHELLQLQPRLAHVKLVSRTSPEGAASVIEVKRSKTPLASRMDELRLRKADISPAAASALAYEVVQATNLLERDRYYVERIPRGRHVGCTLSHFLPSFLSICYDDTAELAESAVQLLLVPETSYRRAGPQAEAQEFISPELIAKVLSLLEEKMPVRSRQPGAQPLLISMEPPSLNAFAELKKRIPHTALRAVHAEHRDDLVRLARGTRPERPALKSVPVAREESAFIQYFFSEAFKYLGPLRDEPKAAYPLGGAQNPNDVGLRGEYTAAVLDLHRHTRIEYIPAHHFLADGSSGAAISARLEEAVLDWLNYMGVVQRVETRDMGVLGHELKVAIGPNEGLHNLVHVGVGVSQVLPILVMSLLADAGSVLVFEQPELHLHPKVQTLLGDFFLSMALSGRQCIVETHSEYIINRLRYRAAVAPGSRVSSELGFYFVEKTGPRSAYRQVRVNAFGAIDDWPQDFFDQSPREAERILRAALRKRSEGKDGNA